MFGVSFIIPTAGDNDTRLQKIVTSIENCNIPEYQIIVIGGASCIVNNSNLFHIPFDEAQGNRVSLKKMIGVRNSKFENLVIMHDYHVFDPNWYVEFVNFGLDWDICVQQQFLMKEEGGFRSNGWRCGNIPGYPEIPFNMPIPWDIDCFIPYMAIQGSFWVAKKQIMLEQPLDERLLWGQEEDIEWSSRVVPNWLGVNTDRIGYKIVANPRCIARVIKPRSTFEYGARFEKFDNELKELWDKLRNGYRRSGVYHYERSINKVVLAS